MTQPHDYLSTACLHGEHGYCSAATRPDGRPKFPARCKWCNARCRCDCHSTQHARPHPRRTPETADQPPVVVGDTPGTSEPAETTEDCA